MKNKKIYTILLIGTICSIGLVTLLFALSEKSIKREKNTFIRRYPHRPVTQTHALDIGYNSYYIAGVDKDKIYLGNNTAPLHLLVLDSTLKDTQHIRLHLERKNLPFRSIKVRVDPPYFYVMDGTVPTILRGKTSDWNASLIMEGDAYFSFAEPMDSSTVVIRARRSSTNENVLGRISMGDSVQVDLFSDLLQKQIDGVFCTDGELLFNKELQKPIYVYNYRNQFVVADTNLEQEYIGKTIDTVSRAQIELASISSKKVTTLASPPLVVNRQSSAYGNYLFVCSGRLGRYEPSIMLDQASIIDVYDLRKNTYKFSFYLYDHLLKRMSSFRVHGDKLIAMMDTHVVINKLKQERFGDMMNIGEPIKN